MELTFSAALLTMSILVPVSTATSRATPVSAELTVRVDRGHPSPLRQAIDWDSARLLHRVGPAVSYAQDKATPAKRRNWVQRHPSCFGAIVGFVGGFLIGFLPGDDAIFDDYIAAFNGAVLGGIGAGTGAILGWAGSR